MAGTNPEKSAPQYFRDLKTRFILSATSIEIVGSGGYSQPIQVVERAIIRKREAAKRISGTEPFDQVWCVIDGDYGSDKIIAARSKALANGISLAISTMCFEYWLILHFQDHQKPAGKCDDHTSILKTKHIPGYTKGKSKFGDIVSNVYEASERAKRFRKNDIFPLPETQNPCSDLYLLIEQIRP